MDVSAFVLLSHEQALRRRMDVVANNMANLSTTGFRREQPLFQEMVRPTKGDMAVNARPVSFVLDQGAVHDTREGAFQATGNPLDLAIDGQGYFAVALADGTTAYTRSGSLKLLESGQLATAAGHPVLGEGGRPITVAPGQQARLSILPDGTVSGTDGPVGRIAVTRFDDEALVDPIGDGLMSGTGGRELAAAETRLRTGGLEGSNVQPIVETNQMVEVLRSYQSSMRMTESLNDMRRQALGRLGRLGN